MKQIKKNSTTKRMLDYINKIASFFIILIYISMGVMYVKEIYVGIVLVLIFRIALSIFIDWLTRTILLEIGNPISNAKEQSLENSYKQLDQDKSKLTLAYVLAGISLFTNVIIVFLYIYIGILLTEESFIAILISILAIILISIITKLVYKKAIPFNESNLDKTLLAESIEDIIVIQDKSVTGV